jgi:hypothetical protein
MLRHIRSLLLATARAVKADTAANRRLRRVCPRARVDLAAPAPDSSASEWIRLVPLYVDRLGDLPQHDHDNERGPVGNKVLLVDRRSFGMPLREEFVLPGLRPKELAKAHLRRSRSRSFNRLSTAWRCGFSSLPGVSRPLLRECGSAPGFGGSTGSNPVCPFGGEHRPPG